MISANCWVPRGFASEFPVTYELDEEEFKRINDFANLQISNSKNEIEKDEEGEVEEEEREEVEEEEKGKISGKVLENQSEIDNDLKEYDFEHYDDDDQEEVGADGEKVSFIPGLSSAARFVQDNEEEDPYLTLPNENEENENKQDLQIYPTDNLILSGRTEDDVSYLDVYVYDDGAGAPEGAEEDEKDNLDPDVQRGFVRESNLYVHHDLMLPAFPLCTEWLNFAPNGANNGENVGNFAAIGTFDPQIEIWNLDMIDKAFPDVILGAPELEIGSKKSKKNKKKKKNNHVLTHHTDAILSLSHNKDFRNVLASSSADNTIKLWDLTTCSAARSMNTIHQGKAVSSLQWHPNSSVGAGSILLSGGYDSTVSISDVRIANESDMVKRWSVNAGEEIENVSWADSSNENIFYAGTDAGIIYGFDIRNESKKPLWKIQAHDSGISSLQANNFVSGMLVTSGMGDKFTKLWKVPITEDDFQQNLKPSMVLSRDMGVGNVLSTAFANDIEVAGHVVIGGVAGPLKMWDAFSNKTVRRTFQNSLKDLQVRAKEYAEQQGRASRIARKYNKDYNEKVFETDARDDEDEDDEDEEIDQDEESS